MINDFISDDWDKRFNIDLLNTLKLDGIFHISVSCPACEEIEPEEIFTTKLSKAVEFWNQHMPDGKQRQELEDSGLLIYYLVLRVFINGCDSPLMVISESC